MKKLTYFIVLITCLGVSSCKKELGAPNHSASLNIINANEGMSQAAINFSASGIPYSNNTFIPYESSLEFGLEAGRNSINVLSSLDTTKTIFQNNLSLVTGGIYSLYLSGSSTKIDTVFLKDNIPYYAKTDSVAGARFINLSPDSQSLSINQVGNTTPDFTSLAYKKITAFKKYPATSSIINNGGYHYEVRDVSGNVLASFNWNPITFKDNTLVITGLVGNGTISVFHVNNY